MNAPKSIPLGRIRGEFATPPSKSLTHRLLIMAALSGQPCIIKNPLYSEDTRLTLTGLWKFGYQFREQGNRIAFSGRQNPAEEPLQLWVGNSGTSARLLTALAALHSQECRIDGSERMRQRPMMPLIQALQALGAEISHQDGHLPLTVKGSKLQGGNLTVDASQSSQFLSALLLIAPFLPGGLTLSTQGKIVSEAYVDLTLHLMEKAGARVEKSAGHYRVHPGGNYRLDRCWAEGDYSSTAFFMVGAAISGGDLTVTNLTPDSLQGDREITEILQEAGAKVFWKEETLHIASETLSGIDRQMSHCPDLVPPAAVLALFARTPSRLRGIAHLRYKESDRIRAIIHNITRLGGKAFLEKNDLIIEPSPLHGALLNSFADHRIAMAFAIAGTQIPGVAIDHSDCVNKSFPGFWEELERLLHTE